MLMFQALNHFMYRFKYRYGKNLPLSVPVDVSLELASTCNMACTYCYHSDQDHLPFTKGLMRAETAFDVINQAADLGVHSLKFNYRGEGTLHPRYRDITAHAKSLATGGTFIDRLANSNFKIPVKIRDAVFEGLANLTKVKVSYDSFHAEVFEKQRAGGIHALTTENIDLFYNHPARLRSDTQLVIQCVRTKLNHDEDLEGQVRRRWPSATVSIRDMVAGRVDTNLDDLEHRKRDKDNRQPCQQAFVRLIVHHDGRVGPCCPSIGNNLLVGDVKKQSLYEIFNGRAAKNLRRSLKDGSAFTMEPCKGCSSFESYKGFKPNWNS